MTKDGNHHREAAAEGVLPESARGTRPCWLRGEPTGSPRARSRVQTPPAAGLGSTTENNSENRHDRGLKRGTSHSTRGLGYCPGSRQKMRTLSGKSALRLGVQGSEGQWMFPAVVSDRGFHFLKHQELRLTSTDEGQGLAGTGFQSRPGGGHLPAAGRLLPKLRARETLCFGTCSKRPVV